MKAVVVKEHDNKLWHCFKLGEVVDLIRIGRNKNKYIFNNESGKQQTLRRGYFKFISGTKLERIIYGVPDEI